MGGGGESSENTTTVFKDLPGATGDMGYGTSGRLFGQAEGLTNAGMSSPFSKSLEDMLLNPQFGAQTGAEQSLINSLMDMTAGRGAVSGLGAPTQSSLATSIAPTLVSLRDQQIKNLMGAKGQDLTQWQTQLQALLELTGLAMPQTVSGTSSTGQSNQYGLIGGFNPANW